MTDKAKYMHVNAIVRSYGTEMNDFYPQIEDNPLIKNDRLDFYIDLETGKIKGFPEIDITTIHFYYIDYNNTFSILNDDEDVLYIYKENIVPQTLRIKSKYPSTDNLYMVNFKVDGCGKIENFHFSEDLDSGRWMKIEPRNDYSGIKM